MAFAAQTGATPRIAWLLYIVTVLWAVVYDTMYAMADREEDIRAGVKSTAILFDEADRLIIVGSQTDEDASDPEHLAHGAGLVEQLGLPFGNDARDAPIL